MHPLVIYNYIWLKGDIKNATAHKNHPFPFFLFSFGKVKWPQPDEKGVMKRDWYVSPLLTCYQRDGSHFNNFGDCK